MACTVPVHKTGLCNCATILAFISSTLLYHDTLLPLKIKQNQTVNIYDRKFHHKQYILPHWLSKVDQLCFIIRNILKKQLFRRLKLKQATRVFALNFFKA
jgi:hypothetical protein